MDDKRYIGSILKEINAVLAKIKTNGQLKSYGIIGGVAVGAIALPRATKDVDFLVSARDNKSFFDCVNGQLSGKYKLEFSKAEGRIFPYDIIKIYDKDEGNRISDILVATLNWQREICDNTIKVAYGNSEVPVVGTEGMIVLKLKSAGPVDMIDVESILNAVTPEEIDKEKLFDWGKRAGVEKLLKKIVNGD